MRHLKCSLLIGLFLLLPATAMGQVSPQCDILLNPALTAPISTYVQRVVQRAEGSFANLSGPQPGPGFDIPHWAQHAGAAVIGLVNRNLRITEQTRDLSENTACLHLDTLIVQCEIEKVRQRLNTAITETSIPDILRLEDLIFFLNERLASLLQGAHDPMFEDPTWGEYRLFDKPVTVWGCSLATNNTCTSMPRENCGPNCAGFLTEATCARQTECTASADVSDALCPFSSDYGPATRNGFGCTLAVMDPRAGATKDPIFTFERDSQKQIIDRLQTLITQNTANPAVTVIGPTHSISGCGQRFGYCQNNQSMRCAEDADCTGFGACKFDFDPPGSARESLRNPFSLAVDQWSLLMEFSDQRKQEGASRYFPEEWSTPAELKSMTGSTASVSPGNFGNPLSAINRTDQRSLRSGWGGGQGLLEANTYALTTAVQADSKLRDNLRKLADLVSKPEGIRSFIIRLGYFARRTCLYRQCGKRLEQIMRIAYSDQCFPYADATYLDDTEADPRWKKCAEDACIPLPGTQLPDSCYCFRKQGDTYTLTAPDGNPSPDYCVKL